MKKYHATSFLTTTFPYTLEVGVTAAAGTKLALQLNLTQKSTKFTKYV